MPESHVPAGHGPRLRVVEGTALGPRRAWYRCTARQGLALDLGIDPKMLSDRIGHANTSVTLQIYTHRSAGRDQAMAQTLGEMIQAAIGSRLGHDVSAGQNSGANATDSPSGEEPHE